MSSTNLKIDNVVWEFAKKRIQNVLFVGEEEKDAGVSSNVSHLISCF